MGQLVKQISKVLTTADTQATDIDLYIGGVANEQDIIEMIRIRNNDAVTQVVTIKIFKFDSGYTSVFEKAYTILTGEFTLATEFLGQVLIGDATNPDKLVVEFDTAMAGSDEIQVLGSAVRFS